MNVLQLDLFISEEECEIQQLRKEVSQLKASQDRQRKALFARQGDLIKGQIDFKDRLEILERNICKTNKDFIK